MSTFLSHTLRNTKTPARSLIKPAGASKPTVSKFSSSDSHCACRSVMILNMLDQVDGKAGRPKHHALIRSRFPILWFLLIVVKRMFQNVKSFPDPVRYDFYLPEHRRKRPAYRASQSESGITDSQSGNRIKSL